MTYDNILDRCLESYENHVMSKEYFEFYNNLITIPSMLMVSIATILSTYVSQSDNEYIKISLIILNALTTFLITINNFLKYGQKSENHRICADNYDNLITKIRYEKEYPDEDVKIFMQTIEKSILEIKKINIYLIPSHLRKKNKMVKSNSKTNLLVNTV
jgi:hypothetical protein